MEPIQGTNNALALIKIATEYMDTASKLDMAQAGLVLDAARDTGAQLVELLEGLGENIDLYT
ncbi:MAG: hypothetical protein U9P80_00095 [Thermodesulfobacteriota bacterium]|nr:hypothetical protein [Thermodesulfobacteriota bacterium]